jgi:hypothetical protein
MGKLQLIPISCTAKLLKRSRLNPEKPAEPPTTALGDWHANLIYIHRNQLILFVNDHSHKTAFELLQKRYGPKAGVAEQAGSLF